MTLDLIELEFLLLALASYTEAEARTLDTLNLQLCAQNARKATDRARAICEALRAKESKTFTLAAEVPWAPATIVVADTCCECHAAEPVLVWNRAYPVCQRCADAWTRKREQARAPKKD